MNVVGFGTKKEVGFEKDGMNRNVPESKGAMDEKGVYGRAS